MKAYLRLMRPANIVTAIADILLGFAASGSVVRFALWDADQLKVKNIDSLFFLIIATIGLYGGGVVFNDVFDYRLDQVERPERPLPSGKASVTGAIVLGIFLLMLGIISAFFASMVSGFISIVIAFLALIYDAYGKHKNLLGPINMGACRGANLLLGISAIPASTGKLWFLALIPVIYISAITVVSRGEVRGADTKSIYGALILYSLVLITIIALAVIPDFDIYYTLPFFLLFCCAIFPPLLMALYRKEARQIRKAVRAGILALIIMDACIASGFAGLEYGIMVLFLLPLSLIFAKSFAVT